ncbi:MAG: DUF1573 domain-containing protein [Planctomycetaceae bacterium]
MSFRPRQTFTLCLLAAGLTCTIYGGYYIVEDAARQPFELSIEPKEIYLSLDDIGGQNAIGRRVAVDVTVTNTGRQPISIADLETTCSCAVAQPFDPKPLQKDESRTLRFYVRPPSYGKKRSIVTVHTSPSLAPTEIIFYMSGVSVQIPFVNVVPDAIQLVAEAFDEPVTHQFSVETGERIGTSGQWLSGMTSTSQDVSITLLGVEDLRTDKVKQILIRRYDFELSCEIREGEPRVKTFAIHTVTQSPAGTTTNDKPIPVRLSVDQHSTGRR